MHASGCSAAKHTKLSPDGTSDLTNVLVLLSTDPE
jgi:hypothetical protein